MEDYIAQARREREACEDFLTANPRQHSCTIFRRSPSAQTYSLQSNIGLSKYVVNFHDGQKTHSDGSPFSDIRVFKNKRKRDTFVRDLRKLGYQIKE